MLCRHQAENSNAFPQAILLGLDSAAGKAMGKRPASGTPPSANKALKTDCLGPWGSKLLACAQPPD